MATDILAILDKNLVVDYKGYTVDTKDFSIMLDGSFKISAGYSVNNEFTSKDEYAALGKMFIDKLKKSAAEHRNKPIR